VNMGKVDKQKTLFYHHAYMFHVCNLSSFLFFDIWIIRLLTDCMLDILQHKSVKTMKENVNEVKLLPVLGINVFLQKKKRNWVANTKWNSTMS